MRDPNQLAFLDFLGRVPFDELVIVGDLFDIWFVPGHAVPVQGVPVIGKLLELIREGRKVTWIAGNHDWVPGVQPLGIQVASAWETTRGGSRIVAVHGDEGADPRLRQRLFDRLIRARLSAAGARALGPAFMWRLGSTVSSWSRGKGHDDLQEVLLRQNELADRLLGEGRDIVVVGHSHAPGMVPRRRGTLVNLGDWLEHHTFARIDEAVRLLHWTGTEEVAVEPGPPQRRPRLLRGEYGADGSA